jgi:hypothetical protein
VASGDLVVSVLDVFVPTTLFAVLTRRVGASAPAEGINVWAFDAATIWYLDFLCVLRGLSASGGLTFTLPWTAATATTGVTRWGIAIRRLQAGTDDIDVAHTYDYNVLDATAPATSGFVLYSEIAFTTGVDMDSWANNELAIVRVRREANHANDTMAGNAELHGVPWGRET